MLTPEIQIAIQTLARGCEGIDAVTGASREENRFSRALAQLQSLAIEHRLPMAIVGGLGAIRYGYAAATQDIGIAVGRDDLQRLLQLAPEHEFRIVWKSDTGWHTIAHGDVEINIVPEGGKANDSAPTFIPSPRDMGAGQGLQYASIERWMELKVSSNRQKDRAHVVEVLKQTSAETTQRIRAHLQGVHPTYAARFEELARQASEEQSQEQKRR